jgi:hypothetical protein
MPVSEYTACDGNYMAKVLGDSVSPDGVRLTTLIARFPRFILAELNTHRVKSRNSASSRAIPTERLIGAVWDDPFIPETFNARVKGMGIGEELDGEETNKARRVWLAASQSACRHARSLAEIGIDKSRANRLLEPFMWHTAIISATEWDNMFALRAPDGEEPDRDFPAQWEFQQAAILMRRAMNNSDPSLIEYGDWHLPFIHPIEHDDIEVKKKVCVRQLARVSFDTHTQNEDIFVSVTKAGDLSSSAHFSPFEHVARPLHYNDTFNSDINDKILLPLSLMAVGKPMRQWVDKMWCGNFRGWIQMRKEFAFEDNHRRAIEAAAP